MKKTVVTPIIGGEPSHSLHESFKLLPSALHSATTSKAELRLTLRYVTAHGLCVFLLLDSIIYALNVFTLNP